MIELAQLVNYHPLELKFPECQESINLLTLVESAIHANHNPRPGTAPPSTYVSPCPNPKCSDIPFPHEQDTDHVLMMHEILTLEGEDPKLTEMMCLMRPAKPRYGLGYLEQANCLIPDCRFCPVPADCKKPAVMEMHKFFSLMDGCVKSEINEKSMKAMINLDLYTNPQADEFDENYTPQEKKELVEDWKHSMEITHGYLSIPGKIIFLH